MRKAGVCLVQVAALPLLAAAQPQPPSYGHTFLTIGAPGNRPANQQEAPWLFPPFQQTPRLMGGVNYEYRITQTEVTVGHWLEFVNAYKPYYTGSPNAIGFTSEFIHLSGSQYVMTPGSAKYPANMNWRYAARYVNWLCNGKALNQAAFENGAYDTSTFTQTGSSFNDQSVHTPGAPFWIASEDEWVKAVYYDPDRYGKGEGGYWRHPGGRDTPYISGLPGEGGETNAGVNHAKYGNGDYMNVDAYPQSLTPWGLLGASGGCWEFTETWSGPAHTSRQRHGSEWFGNHDDFDRLDFPGASIPIEISSGFRIVSIVPAPSGVGVFLMAAALLSRRRHRQDAAVRRRGPRTQGVRRMPGAFADLDFLA